MAGKRKLATKLMDKFLIVSSAPSKDYIITETLAPLTPKKMAKNKLANQIAQKLYEMGKHK